MSKEYGKEFEPPESKGGSVPLTKGKMTKEQLHPVDMPSNVRGMIRGDKGRHILGGMRFRLLKENEVVDGKVFKPTLFKLIEQPKKEEENNDNG